MRRLLSCIATITAVLTMLTFGVAQEKDKESNPEIKITTRTELVLIPTLVTDKSGNHIAGLKKEDFTVLENGSRREVATFEEITSDPHLAHPRNPNEFTNFAGAGITPRITVILLDLINTPFPDQANMRNQLLKYISQSLDRREPTGLFTLDRSGVHVIHDFTTDPDVLIAALHKVRGEPFQLVDTPKDMEMMTGTASPQGNAGDSGGSGGASGRPGSSKALESQMQQEAERMQVMIEDTALNFQSFEQRIAITDTLEGMQEVARALAGFRGRKSVIWAGGGFPFSVSDTTMQLAPAGRDSLSDALPLYERTWQLLNDAQIALYPVDVKGLQSNMPNSSIGRPGRRPGDYAHSVNWHRLDAQASFETFAAATGGRAYYNSNDLVKGFREAVLDSAQYYMLGYYLDQSHNKPGWRKLSVKVNHDHVNVRARSGFLATKSAPDSRNSNDIALALKSPMNYTALPLTGHWEAPEVSKEAGKKRVIYVVDLAPDAGVMDPNDRNHIALDIATSATTGNGLQVARPSERKIDVYPSPELLTKVREKGVGLRGALELAAGEYTVRIVVRDNLSGRIGSMTAPVRVE